jgi:hypothetical protein
MVALMVAVPAAVVLRILPPVILAPVVPAVTTLHIMVLLVALLGTTVPVNVSGEVAVAVVGIPVMSVTAICAGGAVESDAEALAGEARWVAVSALRCVKGYDVEAVNPLKVVEDWNAPPLRLYSHPETVVSVILLGVLLAMVGAAGAVCVALVTATVAGEVTLPLQLAAETTTVMVLPMSAATKV